MLILGVLVIAGIVLFPPWIFVYHYEPIFRGRGTYDQRIERPAGYHAIWDSHVPTDPTALGQLFSVTNVDRYESDRLDLKYFSMRLDKDRLWIEVAGALIVTLLLTFLLKSRTYIRNE